MAAAERVRRRSVPDGECLIWQGAVNSAGTAVVGIGKRVLAISRVLWIAKYGAPPDGKLERTCGASLCVNVDHLRVYVPEMAADRFWQMVDTSGPAHPTDPSLGRCWDWAGVRLPTGYGRLHAPDAGDYAHRLSLMLATGKALTPGLFVLHSCDRPSCVNPTHLREGTQQENVTDRDVRYYGRSRA